MCMGLLLPQRVLEDHIFNVLHHKLESAFSFDLFVLDRWGIQPGDGGGDRREQLAIALGEGDTEWL